MKTQQPKIKNPPRPLFSCGIFGHCTQTVLSPTAPKPPPVVVPPHPPPPTSDPHPPSSSSSSSSSASQSFTQWRFPLPKPSHHFSHHHPHPSPPPLISTPASDQKPLISPNFAEIFHAAELHLSSDSDEARLAGLQLLERSLLPDPLPDDSVCPPAVMAGVVGFLKKQPHHAARAATKVLLALCLAEPNRRAAVEAGAVAGVVESVTEMEGAAAERALAALELLCTVPEGAAELRAHALAVPALVEMMGKMGGRGKECAISALAAIFAGAGENPPTGVAQAVLLALQGDCTARARRKGAQLLKPVQDNHTRPDAPDEGN